MGKKKKRIDIYSNDVDWETIVKQEIWLDFMEFFKVEEVLLSSRDGKTPPLLTTKLPSQNSKEDTEQYATRLNKEIERYEKDGWRWVWNGESRNNNKYAFLSKTIRLDDGSVV